MSNCFVKRREKQLDRERDTVRKGDKVRRVSGDVAEDERGGGEGCPIGL